MGWANVPVRGCGMDPCVIGGWMDRGAGEMDGWLANLERWMINHRMDGLIDVLWRRMRDPRPSSMAHNEFWRAGCPEGWPPH